MNKLDSFWVKQLKSPPFSCLFPSCLIVGCLSLCLRSAYFIRVQVHLHKLETSEASTASMRPRSALKLQSYWRNSPGELTIFLMVAKQKKHSVSVWPILTASAGKTSATFTTRLNLTFNSPALYSYLPLHLKWCRSQAPKRNCCPI